MLHVRSVSFLGKSVWGRAGSAGIPEDRHGFRAATLNASTDVRHGNHLHLPSNCDGRGDSPRRPRQETITPVLSYSFPLQPIQLFVAPSNTYSLNYPPPAMNTNAFV